MSSHVYTILSIKKEKDEIGTFQDKFISSINSKNFHLIHGFLLNAHPCMVGITGLWSADVNGTNPHLKIVQKPVANIIIGVSSVNLNKTNG